MAQRPRNGIALASIDLKTGLYTYYEQYKSAIFDKLLPQEKVSGIEGRRPASCEWVSRALILVD